MQPVGCYLSHTRSEILLSEKDIQFFERYFPAAWQIALVLRPNRLDPVRAGFFFREPDGSIHAGPTRHEFIIPTWTGKPAASTRATQAPIDAGLTATEPRIPDPAPCEPVSQPSTVRPR